SRSIAAVVMMNTISFNDNRPYDDLLSFPTRRSSDLRDRAIHDDEKPHDPTELDLTDASRLQEKTEKQQVTAMIDGANRRQNFVKDRKSTRLNSSHVKISYAVFCLKKKKKQ